MSYRQAVAGDLGTGKSPTPRRFTALLSSALRWQCTIFLWWRV